MLVSGYGCCLSPLKFFLPKSREANFVPHFLHDKLNCPLRLLFAQLDMNLIDLKNNESRLSIFSLGFNDRYQQLVSELDKIFLRDHLARFQFCPTNNLDNNPSEQHSTKVL